MKEFVLVLVLTCIPVLCMGLDDLPELGKPVMKRVSTYDPTGGNDDRYNLTPGEVGKLEIAGAGSIKHIWFTFRSADEDYLRKIRLRMYWDGEEEPSVDVPLGDFFCLGHGEVNDVVSSVIVVSKAPHVKSPPGQAAFNSYFPMPFARGARIEVENACDASLIFYAYVDYEVYDSPDRVANLGRFHAQYLSEETVPPSNTDVNLSGDDNYVILDVKGEGHYVGCSLSVDSRPSDPGKWWEGDDMIFVDGEDWPPAIHGTGTEDYFSLAWGFRREINTPYYGCSYLRQQEGDRYYNGLYTVYRFHIVDPISFKESIRVTMEHGHGNDAGNRFSSVAYYYLAR